MSNKQYSNENRGALFVNDRKEHDNHPDLKGSINVDGKDYWLSAWNRDTAKGPVISISVQAKDSPRQGVAKAGAAKREAQRPAQRDPEPDFVDDDFTF